MTAVRMGADERRELVVKAALVEFAQSGLNGTSTEAVAKRAGISQPYIFRLFATKKDLFIAVVTSCFERVYDAFVVAAEGKAGDDAKDAMGYAYGELLADRALLLTQMHAYAASDDPDIRAATTAGYRRLWQFAAAATGMTDEALVLFFSTGMMINVAAAMHLPDLHEPWAEAVITYTCPDLRS